MFHPADKPLTVLIDGSAGFGQFHKVPTLRLEYKLSLQVRKWQYEPPGGQVGSHLRLTRTTFLDPLIEAPPGF